MSMQGMATRTRRMGRRLDDYKSYAFDGNSDYVDISGSASVFDFNNDPHSVSVWFKMPDTSRSYEVLWSCTKTGSNYPRYWLAVRSSGSLGFFGWGDVAGQYAFGGGAGETIGSGLDDDEWHNVVVAYNGSNVMKVYVDGGSPTTIAVANVALDPDLITVGARILPFGITFPGLVRIFQLGVYDREVSAADVANIYNYYGPAKGMNEKNFVSAAPKHYYRFGDGDNLLVTESPGVLKDYGTAGTPANGTEYNMDTDPASGSYVVKDDRP